MPDDITPDEPTTEPAAGATTEPGAPVDGKPPANPEDGLEEWVRTELSKVRGEAANYRTKLREAEAALAKATTPEEFEKVKTELTTKVNELEHELLRTRVAVAHKLPDELAAVLKGKTEEELVEHAKSLAKFVPAAPTKDPEPATAPKGEPSGGLDPSGGSEDPDAGKGPRELAAKYGNRK